MSPDIRARLDERKRVNACPPFGLGSSVRGRRPIHSLILREVVATIGRMHARFAVAASLTLLLAACGGDDKQVKDPSSANGDEGAPAADGEDDKADRGDAKSDEAPEETSGIPTKCAERSGDICLPSNKFAKKMCNGDYPTVAMKLFSAGTPWTRGYLTHETNAWNASGGGSSNEKLKLDEEVLVLRHRKPSGDEGGMQVSGASGGFDALRWDGMCVTLDESELRFDPPQNPRNARLVWTRIEIDTRDALKKDDTVREMYIAYKKECKGVTVGSVSKKCEELDGKLSVVIANYVRTSGESLPVPKKMPE